MKDLRQYLLSLLSRKAFWELLFWILLIFNLLPVLSVDHFYTGDGPAHLYNAQVIRWLLLDAGGPWSDFFELRKELIPNLGGHVLLSMLLAVFSPLWAEKLLYILIMLLTATGFRYALAHRSLQLSVIGILAMPLLQHFCIYIGFQSFSLGMAIMLWCVALHSRSGREAHWRSQLLLSGLLLICAFCHPVPTLVFVGYFVLHSVARGVAFRKNAWKQFLILIPACLLVLLFVGREGKGEEWAFPKSIDQWHSLLDLQPIIAHHLVDQAPAARLYALSLLLASVFVLIWRKPVQTGHRALILTALAMGTAYFLLPPSWATGGFIHVRILLCALFFWALWLGYQLASRALIWRLFLLPVIAANIMLVTYNLREAKYHDKRAALLMQAADHIPEGAVIVPLNYSQHWLHYNIGLYPSALRKSVNLDNYEAYEAHFPVKWKEGMAPAVRLGPFGASRNPAFALEPYESETGMQVEAVLACFDMEFTGADSTTAATKALLEAHFSRSSAGEGYSLWLRNND